MFHWLFLLAPIRTCSGQRVLGARLRAHYLPNLALNWVKRGAMERREGMYCHMNRTWNTTSHLIKISLFQGIFFASYIANDLKKGIHNFKQYTYLILITFFESQRKKMRVTEGK